MVEWSVIGFNPLQALDLLVAVVMLGLVACLELRQGGALRSHWPVRPVRSPDGADTARASSSLGAQAPHPVIGACPVAVPPVRRRATHLGVRRYVARPKARSTD